MLTPEPLTYQKNYSAHRFSTLNQIDARKVKNLKVAWTMQLGGVEGGGIFTHGGLEGTPIVENGFMYITDGWGSVYKIDAHIPRSTMTELQCRPTGAAESDDAADASVRDRGL